MSANRKVKKWNPFLIYYLSLAIVSCALLIVVFLFVYYENVKRTQEDYNRAKLELVSEMLDSYVETQKDLSYTISIMKVFQPYYFCQNKYLETELLDSFSTLNRDMTVVGRAFICYGDDIIFGSDGYSRSREVYLKPYTEAEREVFRSVLQDVWSGIRLYSTTDSLCFFSSIKMTGVEEPSYAVYWFEMSHEELNERIQLVSGGMKGSYTIYDGENILYSSDGNVCREEDSGVISSISDDGRIKICWRADRLVFPGSVLPLSILCVVSAVLLILVFASYFARKSYVPIYDMVSRYRGKLLNEENKMYQNGLEELEDMMSSALQRNINIGNELARERARLKKQIMKLVLNGSYPVDSSANKEQVKELFPGSHFFVISILLEEEDEMLLQKMAEQIEFLEDCQQGQYVLVLCDHAKKAIYTLCCLDEEEQCQDLKESVYEVVDSYERKVKIGTGKTYKNLAWVSASYLESVERAHDYTVNPRIQQTDKHTFIYNRGDIYWLSREMAQGNEEDILREFEKYMKKLRCGNVSQLMLQYIFSDFISEISAAASDCQIELEKSSLSLLVSARTLDGFQEAVEAVMHEYCVKLKNKQAQLSDDMVSRVVSYMKMHFADYDISLDKVVEELGVTSAFVRNAIKEKTGKSYRDYLVFLRIEYAKELLERSRMNVAEICEKVGYTNISYFVKLFRESTGLPPATWRDSLCQEKETD